MFLRRRSDTPAIRGQAMVEFALLVPLLALFLVIAVDFGRAFFSYVQITNASREAAALGAFSPSGPIDDNAMRDRALLEANIQDHAGEDDTIQLTAVCRDPAGTTIPCASASGGAGPGNTVTVTVTRDFGFLTPLVNDIIGNDFQMRVSATAPVLGFAGSGSGGGPIGSCSPPVAAFSATVISGLTVEVDPQASSPQNPGDPCNISGVYWYWGDGDDIPGTATAAQHTYASPNAYTITLEVTNQAGTDSATQSVTVPEGAPVPCDPPDARFTFTTTGNGSNRWFTYIDQSTVADPANCAITSWLWTFHALAGGTQSNAQFPAAFQYSSGGSKSVTLEVTNSAGSDSLTKSGP